MTDRVCLVIPPSPFLLDERVFMSLGPLKVAAALERAGVPVEVLDLSGVKNYEDAVAAHVRGGSATTYGLTATSPQLPAAVKIAAVIRSHETFVPRRAYRIILGGPHVTLVNAARKREEKRSEAGRAHRAFNQLWDHFNVLVAGDGEEAIFEALEGITPRFIDADGRDKPMFLDDKRLDETAWPARHLVDVNSYRYTVDGVPALSLIAQLGCPFACGFCAGRHSPMLRHTRMRSADSIAGEMLHLRRTYGTRGFMFYDDELNVNPKLVELMEKIAEIGDDWHLRGFIKAELFTDPQAEAMARAGFRWILVGFESGSPRILDNIRKRATQDDNSRCMEIARRHGLKVKALMSLGHPGESLNTMEETWKWLLDERPDDFDVTIITPYPGSPYYDDATLIDGVWTYACRNGDRLHQDEVDYTAEADYYKGAPDGGYVARVWTDHLDRIDLVHGRDTIEREVREALGIPFYAAVPAMLYEHSMGMTSLPPHILRSTA